MQSVLKSLANRGFSVERLQKVFQRSDCDLESHFYSDFNIDLAKENCMEFKLFYLL